ncbi:MAG TPA: hypothetical protein VGV35_00775 [Bryobacteraceae bacterium]|nr:hypothetical protein [Bryobacteraceae bacterium]
MRQLLTSIAFAVTMTAQQQPDAAVDASAVFARLKAMAGNWQEKSTKGWTGGNKIRVIARGSAVLFESSFDGEPNEGMATLFYVDKGRLLLTHYCEARNQPTLIASSASDDGNSIVFEFLSGTGMKSRDDGHMDKLVMKFISPDSYSEQWTWYNAGKERWLEEIVCKRAPRESPAGR